MRIIFLTLLVLGLSPAQAQSASNSRMYRLSDLWAVCPIHGDEGVSGKYWLQITPAYRSEQALHLQIVPLDAAVPFSPVDVIKTVESGDVEITLENEKTSLLISAGSKGAAIVMTVVYQGLVPSSVDAAIIYNNRVFASDCIILSERERSKL